MASGTRADAQKTLNKSEYKLFTKSLPEQASKLTAQKIKAALKSVQKLLKKNQSVKLTLNGKKAALFGSKIKFLKAAQKRFSKNLDWLEQGAGFVAETKGSSKKSSVKSKIERHESPQQHFKNSEQAKIYDKDHKADRQKNSPGRLMSKRIAGYMKARTRKGQVARDRVSSAKEE